MNEEIKRPEATEPRWPRWDYKTVWTNLSDTPTQAKMVIAGSEDEESFSRGGPLDADFLREKVAINPIDTVLEIGCGVGRVGAHLAPHCQLLDRVRCFAQHGQIRTGAAGGCSECGPGGNARIRPGSDRECIGRRGLLHRRFCHIDEWDRYRYGEEAVRVLRPGGRLCVNNVNLGSDAGWAAFETLRKIHPTQRPPYIAKCSTPAELEEYLKRARFGQIETSENKEFVWVWGIKPA